MFRLGDVRCQLSVVRCPGPSTRGSRQRTLGDGQLTLDQTRRIPQLGDESGALFHGRFIDRLIGADTAITRPIADRIGAVARDQGIRYVWRVAQRFVDAVAGWVEAMS